MMTPTCGLCSQGLPMSGGGLQKKKPTVSKAVGAKKSLTTSNKVAAKKKGGQDINKKAKN